MLAFFRRPNEEAMKKRIVLGYDFEAKGTDVEFGLMDSWPIIKKLKSAKRQAQDAERQGLKVGPIYRIVAERIK